MFAGRFRVALAKVRAAASAIACQIYAARALYPCDLVHRIVFQHADVIIHCAADAEKGVAGGMGAPRPHGPAGERSTHACKLLCQRIPFSFPLCLFPLFFRICHNAELKERGGCRWCARRAGILRGWLAVFLHRRLGHGRLSLGRSAGPILLGGV